MRTPRAWQTSLALAATLASAGVGAQAAPAARASSSAVLELRHVAGLQALARAVSDPRSPRYRDYESIEALTERFGAPRRTRARISAWARAHRLSATTMPGGDYVLLSGDAASLRSALGAAGDAAGAATAQAHVPQALRGEVIDAQLLGVGPVAVPARARVRVHAKRIPEYDVNDPYHGLPASAGSAAKRSGTPAGCPEGVASGGFTPNQIADAYGLDTLHRRGLRGEGMRIALVETDGFLRSDVAAFARCFGAKVPAIHTTSLEGRPLPPGAETPLDLETMIAAAPRLRRIDVYEASSNNLDLSGDLLRASALAIETPGQRPDAISLSLGDCEAAFGVGAADGGSLLALRALSDTFALAAASGISVFASSGDNGSAGCARVSSTALPLTQFPASSPWVTAVGGTNLQLSATNAIEREVVWNDTPLLARAVAAKRLTVAPEDIAAAGGGGRSLLFDRPWWQRAPGLSDSPRRVPDVSALADELPGYAYFCTSPGCEEALKVHGWGTVGGTSASSPLVAAGVTLLDQAARRHGQAPLGFIDPLLYELANSGARSSIVDDVTIGSNDVTAAMPSSSLDNLGRPLGVYPAAPGYDFASGWGSLRFAGFDRAALRAGRRTAR